MLTFYNLFIIVYQLAVRLAALWNPKAQEWVVGRKQWGEELKQEIDRNSPWIWIHCASAGEFEQGKPVLEKIKAIYPHYKILVTFFSPSGYNVGKKYKMADHISFLPLDTASNARQFLSIVTPKLVVFVKYDYWYHHLKAIKDQQIPLLLVSALFRESQPFFKWYGWLHRKMLRFFTHLFVQDGTSKELLQTINIRHCTISGDTRFDRVVTLAENFTELEIIQAFAVNKKILVAGSTWPDDEAILKSALDNNRDIKLIIAPHEITSSHIEYLLKLFPTAIKYSALEGRNVAMYPILVIDNIGMLSRLYHYAAITYIGGGFNKSGIHNTLEAAVWGKPVLFGPNYQKFKEARELVENKAAYSITNADDLHNVLDLLLENSEIRHQSGMAAQAYVQQQKGATNAILRFVQENRLLTN